MYFSGTTDAVNVRVIVIMRHAFSVRICHVCVNPIEKLFVRLNYVRENLKILKIETRVAKTFYG